MKYFKVLCIMFMMFIMLFSTGCSTKFEPVAPEPPKNYETLGTVSGKSIGSLGIGGTAYYFIPMGLNSRIDRAYQDALSDAPGATSLIDVTFQEDWFWWVIGTGRTVTISGEAIREVR